MKGTFRLAARLYPQSWRERYGAEFEALLDEVELSRSDLFDVSRGAAMMQVRTMSRYWMLAGIVTLASVMVAAVFAFQTVGPYVSSSVIATTAGPGENSANPRLPDRVNLAWQVVSSNFSLSEIIQRSSLDLYRRERHGRPLIDVIEKMQASLRFEPVDGTDQYRISFTDPDKVAAKKTVDALTLKMHDNLSRAKMRVVSDASLPEVSLAPDRLGPVGWGLVRGVMLGILAASFWWRWKWTLVVVGFGLAGLVATAYGTFHGWLPLRYTSHAKVVILPLPSENGRLMSDAELLAWWEPHRAQLFSDASLKEIVEWPRADLYTKERATMPMSAVLAKIRKDLVIEVLNSRSALRISFTYPDRFKAQGVVSVVVGLLNPEPMLRHRAFVAASKDTHWLKDATVLGCTKGPGWDYECINNHLNWLRSEPPRPRFPVDLIEAASLPETPAPSARTLMFTGMGAGMLIGALVWRKASGSRPRMESAGSA